MPAWVASFGLSSSDIKLQCMAAVLTQGGDAAPAVLLLHVLVRRTLAGSLQPQAGVDRMVGRLAGLAGSLQPSSSNTSTRDGCLACMLKRPRMPPAAMPPRGFLVAAALLPELARPLRLRPRACMKKGRPVATKELPCV